MKDDGYRLVLKSLDGGDATRKFIAELAVLIHEVFVGRLASVA
jgi:hypothetical protein